MTNVLIVEDDVLVRKSLARYLGRHFLCETAANGFEALVKLGQRSFDLVITDIEMPDLDGDALIRRIRQDKPQQNFVICTANHSRVPDLRSLGVPIFIKPLDAQGLLREVCAATGVPVPDARNVRGQALP